MPKPTADRVVTQKHIRYFLQKLGPSPIHPLLYAGVDGQFLNIENVDNPTRGSISPINVQDPRRQGQYLRVGETIEAPDFPTLTVQFMQNHGGIPAQLIDLPECYFNVYFVVGPCHDLSDSLNGWTDYVKIVSYAKNTNTTEGGGSFDGDEAVMDDLEVTAGAVYTIGKIQIGSEAETETEREVVDLTYGNRVQCAACGPDDNGTKLIYALVINSGAAAPEVVYTTDGGSNWASAAITGSGITDVPKAIEVAGNYLLVLTNDGTDTSLWVSQINNITGVPGTFTEITSGFVSTNIGNDMFVAGAREIYICAENGYVYKSQNPLQGVTVLTAGDVTANDLRRIHGLGQTLVAVGTSATVIYSLNGGITWTVASNAPGAATLSAVAVLDEYHWWVGNASGAVYYTATRAQTAWQQITLPSTITAVNDIVFATDEVAYLVGTNSGNAVGFNTYDGGYTWGACVAGQTPNGRFLTWPTLDRINRIAYPTAASIRVGPNYVAFGGLADDGTDGEIVVGSPVVIG